MELNEINFNKQNRRPVTDTTHQIAAEEWNALGDSLTGLFREVEDLKEGEFDRITAKDITRILEM